MATPEGWRKEGELSWVHTKNKSAVKIDEITPFAGYTHENIGGKYVARVWRDGRETGTDPLFWNKDDARKWAVKYMRRNPRG